MFKETKMYVIFRTPNGDVEKGYYYLYEQKRWREAKKRKNNQNIYGDKYKPNYYTVNDVDIIDKNISEKVLIRKYPQYFI